MNFLNVVGGGADITLPTPDSGSEDDEANDAGDEVHDGNADGIDNVGANATHANQLSSANDGDSPALRQHRSIDSNAEAEGGGGGNLGNSRVAGNGGLGNSPVAAGGGSVGLSTAAVKHSVGDAASEGKRVRCIAGQGTNPSGNDDDEGGDDDDDDDDCEEEEEEDDDDDDDLDNDEDDDDDLLAFNPTQSDVLSDSTPHSRAESDNENDSPTQDSRTSSLPKLSAQPAEGALSSKGANGTVNGTVAVASSEMEQQTLQHTEPCSFAQEHNSVSNPTDDSRSSTPVLSGCELEIDDDDDFSAGPGSPMVNRLRPAQFLVQGSPNTPQAVPSTARGQDFANESTKKPPTRLSQSIPEGRLREMQIISQDAPADGTDAPTNRAQDSLTNEAVAVTDVSAPPSNAKIEPHPVPFLNPVGHGLEAGENTLTSTVSSSATATIDNTEPSSMEPKSFNSNQSRSAATPSILESANSSVVASPTPQNAESQFQVTFSPAMQQALAPDQQASVMSLLSSERSGCSSKSSSSSLEPTATAVPSSASRSAVSAAPQKQPVTINGVPSLPLPSKRLWSEPTVAPDQGASIASGSLRVVEGPCVAPAPSDQACTEVKAATHRSTANVDVNADRSDRQLMPPPAEDMEPTGASANDESETQLVPLPATYELWSPTDSAPSAEELARTAAATNQTEAASSEIRSAESVRPVESDSEGGDDDHLDSNESDIDDTELSDNTGGLPSKRVERGTVLSTRRRRTPAVYGDAGLDSLSDSDHSDSDERSQPRRANSHGTNKPSTYARSAVRRRPRNGVATLSKDDDDALFCGSQVALVKDTRGLYHVVRNVEEPTASKAPSSASSPEAARNRYASEDDVIASFSKRFKWVQTRKNSMLRSQQNWTQTHAIVKNVAAVEAVFDFETSTFNARHIPSNIWRRFKHIFTDATGKSLNNDLYYVSPSLRLRKAHTVHGLQRSKPAGAYSAPASRLPRSQSADTAKKSHATNRQQQIIGNKQRTADAINSRKNSSRSIFIGRATLDSSERAVNASDILAPDTPDDDPMSADSSASTFIAANQSTNHENGQKSSGSTGANSRSVAASHQTTRDSGNNYASAIEIDPESACGKPRPTVPKVGMPPPIGSLGSQQSSSSKPVEHRVLDAEDACNVQCGPTLNVSGRTHSQASPDKSVVVDLQYNHSTASRFASANGETETASDKDGNNGKRDKQNAQPDVDISEENADDDAAAAADDDDDTDSDGHMLLSELRKLVQMKRRRTNGTFQATTGSNQGFDSPYSAARKAAARNASPSGSSSDGVPAVVHWAECEKCSKWRVLNEPLTANQHFVCENLDGRDCDDEEDKIPMSQYTLQYDDGVDVVPDQSIKDVPRKSSEGRGGATTIPDKLPSGDQTSQKGLPPRPACNNPKKVGNDCVFSPCSNCGTWRQVPGGTSFTCRQVGAQCADVRPKPSADSASRSPATSEDQPNPNLAPKPHQNGARVPAPDAVSSLNANKNVSAHRVADKVTASRSSKVQPPATKARPSSFDEVGSKSPATSSASSIGFANRQQLAQLAWRDMRCFRAFAVLCSGLYKGTLKTPAPASNPGVGEQFETLNLILGFLGDGCCGQVTGFRWSPVAGTLHELQFGHYSFVSEHDAPTYHVRFEVSGHVFVGRATFSASMDAASSSAGVSCLADAHGSFAYVGDNARDEKPSQKRARTRRRKSTSRKSASNVTTVAGTWSLKLGRAVRSSSSILPGSAMVTREELLTWIHSHSASKGDGASGGSCKLQIIESPAMSGPANTPPRESKTTQRRKSRKRGPKTPSSRKKNRPSAADDDKALIGLEGQPAAEVTNASRSSVALRDGITSQKETLDSGGEPTPEIQSKSTNSTMLVSADALSTAFAHVRQRVYSPSGDSGHRASDEGLPAKQIKRKLFRAGASPALNKESSREWRSPQTGTNAPAPKTPPAGDGTSGAFSNVCVFAISSGSRKQMADLRHVVLSQRGVFVDSFQAAAAATATTRVVAIVTNAGSYQSIKYMLATARNWPIVHSSWVHACTAAGQPVPVRGFWLPAAAGFRSNARLFDVLLERDHLTLSDVTSGACCANAFRPIVGGSEQSAAANENAGGIPKTVALAGANARELEFVANVLKAGGFECVDAAEIAKLKRVPGIASRGYALDSQFVVCLPSQSPGTVNTIARCRVAGVRAVSLSWAHRSLIAGKPMRTLPFETLSVSSPPLNDQEASVVGRSRSQWFSPGRVATDNSRMFFGVCFINGTRWELGEAGIPGAPLVKAISALQGDANQARSSRDVEGSGSDSDSDTSSDVEEEPVPSLLFVVCGLWVENPNQDAATVPDVKSGVACIAVFNTSRPENLDSSPFLHADGASGKLVSVPVRALSGTRCLLLSRQSARELSAIPRADAATESSIALI